MMKIKAIVVDDEAPARSELIYLINKIGGIEVCGEASGAVEAYEKISEYEPHLVFLDIDMQPINGITLARQLQEKDDPPFIIFATAYNNYALDAFEINAVDYIIKPFSEERIKATIQRVIKEIEDHKFHKENGTKEISKIIEQAINKKTQERIPVWKDNRIILLDPADIIFIVTTEGKKTIFKTINGEYETNYSIGEIEEKLPAGQFFRPHRSYLINLNYIKEIEPWFHNTFQLVMAKYENEKIPVSRNQTKEFKKLINLPR